MFKRLLAPLALLLILAGCSAATPAAQPTPSPPALREIRLPMGFIPDPQYAPFYVADKKGYFAEAGIVLEFDYSFETDGVALVGANELPFALASGEQVLLARAQGLPVVFVTEWFQRFPIVVVSKASAGIVSPADLAGRTVGLPGFFGASYVGYVGLLTANGLTQADVNAEEIGFVQIEALLNDQVDAVVGYGNNEPVQLAGQGVDINVIAVADYIDLVANGILTNEKTIADEPALIKALVGAMLLGLRDTLADPDEAFEISKEYVEGLDDSRRDVLTASLALWETDRLGETTPDSWVTTQNVLIDMGFLDGPLDNLGQAYTNEFIDP